MTPRISLLGICTIAFLALAVTPNSAQTIASDSTLALTTVFSNGPINGQTWGWEIDNGFAVSNSFQPNGTVIHEMTLGAWVPICAPVTGCLPKGIDVLIGTTPFAHDIFFCPGCAVTSILHNSVLHTQPPCWPARCTVYTVTVPAMNVAVTSGATLYITLQNAVTQSRSPVYWDMNSGEGCTPPGCPSTAQWKQPATGSPILVTVPSESFTLF